MIQPCQSLDELIEVLSKIGHLTRLLQGEPIDPDSRRKLLQAAMEMTVKVTLSGELGALEKTSDEVMEIVIPLRRAGKALSELSQSSLGLLALHYRAPWLEDGRFTLAGTCPQRLGPILEHAFERVGQRPGATVWLESRDPLGKDFHRELLERYQGLYSRPFSFNDRVFQVVTSADPDSFLCTEPSAWTVEFEAEPGTPILVANREVQGAVRTHYSLKLSSELLDWLTQRKIRDLRSDVLRSVSSETVQRNGHGLPECSSALSDAVEMAWHRVLAQEGSFPYWKDCLIDLKFLKVGTHPSSWISQARDALIEALCFLQGISLYQSFAPGGLTTVTVPKLRDAELALGAMTIGSLSRECTDPLVVALAGSAIDVLRNLYSAAEQPPESSCDSQASSSDVLAGPTTSKTISLDSILGNEDLAGFVRQKIGTIGGVESVLSEVLDLSTKVCNLLHEQRRLFFRFFVGNAVDLSQFREVFVFKDDDQKHFAGWKSDYRALCLKAHYSHLQESGLGLFFEWASRVHFRIVETVFSQRILGMPIDYRMKNDQDPRSIRVSTALKLTEEIPGLVVIDAGEGKIRIYLGGELLVARQEDLVWWRPFQETGWLSRGLLCEELRLASSYLDHKLAQEDERALADALLWVSEISGVGCTLVLTSDFEELTRHMSDLNPRKLAWVKDVPLSGCHCNIRNVLIQDGATILDLGKNTLSGQQQLIPFNPMEHRAVKPDPDSQERWTYGTRRASACDLTKIFPDCVAITVSADGPINIFHNGQPKRPGDIYSRHLRQKSYARGNENNASQLVALHS